MVKERFNLTTDPWIKVIDKNTSQEQIVSLIDLFTNAQNYRQLAGEMHSQDLAIIRLLLAILTTVYSRFDANGKPYDWLKGGNEKFKADANCDYDYDEDEINDDLVATWTKLYQNGEFSNLVINYLEYYADKFDFFGEHPFYQVTKEEYDALVPTSKAVAKGVGTVSIKQINRQISESNNSPALFSPKSDTYKNEVTIDELIRWIITYQNFTGVTDKTKVKASDKFSVEPGWLYRLNPVFVQGKTVFETLMLNLVLVVQNPKPQKPVWEYDNAKEYVIDRQRAIIPNNIAELYTNWSRILHIEWSQDGQPTIYSAGLAKIDNVDALIEPMTVWHSDSKTGKYRPAIRRLESLSNAMWRNFGNYVSAETLSDTQEPGIVSWLRLLKNKHTISKNKILTLASVDLIDNGNTTSQTPIAEVYDDMSIMIDVIFDTSNVNRWPIRIEKVIKQTQNIGTDFWWFANDIGVIRGFQKNELKEFANRLSSKFYDGLNEPFKNWLVKLTDDDNRDQQVIAWQKTIRNYAFNAVQKVINTSSPRDLKGIDSDDGLQNIFISTAKYEYRVNLDLKKEA